MAINVSVQYNGGFFHDIILLTLHIEPMPLPSGNHEEFLKKNQLCSHLINVLTISPP